ncbi:MAG: hypothetical protein FIB01_01410 [Gemmatimonadetes bacterium]|nr:hypothetical protein [Gemmatimonadota bacterium]
MRAALLPAMLLAGACAACRDGVPPYSPVDVPPDTASLRQLTFNTGDERDPQWSADGDSVYYHASNWYDAPGPGTLLRIGAEGGTAVPLADHAQPNPATFLTSPVVPRAGGRLAYLHLARIRSASDKCSRVGGADPGGLICRVGEPVLDSTLLRVRTAAALNPALTDPGLTVRYPGLDSLQWSVGPPPYRQRVYPFHLDWQAGESADLRPSWSPDGSRLVFSDGIALSLWTPASPAATPLPGTQDGVAPAWSPDGNWIAFVVIARGDAAVADCTCIANLSVHHLRSWWQVTGYRLIVIRPDGTGRRELGEGREPAWSPDSKTLYVRRSDGIYRVPVDQPAAAQLVPRTGGGRMPAVSPDGKRLAFVLRESGTGDLDIWTTSLEN